MKQLLAALLFVAAATAFAQPASAYTCNTVNWGGQYITTCY
jgi:hypothetical protein